ncbi:MAG TPA: S9 family peptidase [Terriglobales bacterium]|nr:S9 family peptidase [Terriglobales bacterium]
MTHEPLGERDILRFRMISDPQLSPDGRTVAFVLTEQDAVADRQATSVWLVPADASAEARRLTTGPRDGRPRWSPDGSRLAFLGAREREWARDLYVLPLAGGEAQRVAELPRGATEYAWSPDGSRLALVGGPDFPTDPDRDPPANREEARKRYQERVRYIGRFRYRMDGQGVLDDEARQVWVVAADGQQPPRMLTEGDADVAQVEWTPDGRIAFLSNRDPGHDRSQVTEVYAVPADGGEVERLTHHDKVTAAFGFAPDGCLATLRTDSAEPFGGVHVRLWIGDQCLTRELDRSSTPAVLGDTIGGREAMGPTCHDAWWYFEVGDRGAVHLYRARPGQPPELVIGGRRLNVFSSIAAGTVAFLSTAADDPVTLRAADIDGGRERVLFEPNPWMRDVALGTLRPLDLEHGEEIIDAWALLPPEAVEGKPQPTILFIHGGPHAAYSWSFPFVFQVLAGAGYAVVFCNPPGSQTYSEEFAGRVCRAWGEADFPFFMALVDRAVEAGIADPDRLGVAGASYGGFSTLWTITHTDRFRAAVSMRPVSALGAFYGSSDIGWSFGAHEMGAEPWEDPSVYERLSPVTYLDRVTTPLRLIAGTGDLRTPAEQAEQVFIRLRKMGREVDLVVFHGESHAVVVQGKPWNRVRHLRAVREWFDRHLRGGDT